MAALFAAFALAPLANAQTAFQDPGVSSGEGVFTALKTAMGYWYYVLYLLSPLTIYKAWAKYKEGDNKGMGAYIIGTLGIFLSPALPAIFRQIGAAAGSTVGS